MPKFLIGCYVKASLGSLPRGSSMGKLTTWQLATLEQAIQRGREVTKDRGQCLHNLILEITEHHFSCILSTGSPSVLALQGEGVTQEGES